MAIDATWSDRHILVSGGSSGLGLHLVTAAAKRNAHTTIVGRDPGRLELAQRTALENGAKSANTFSLDLQSAGIAPDEASKKLLAWLEQRPVDLLINAIGRSDRGPLELLSAHDINALFQDNVICTWNMIRYCLPSLRLSHGTVVNIGSLAGIIAAPNMGGYSITKGALTAMSRQLRLELAKDQIHVLLVCPGPIARSDSGTRYQSLAAARGLNPAEASAPGGNAKVKLIDPIVLCDKILWSAAHRKPELIYPSKAKWLASIASFWPSMADRILKRYIRP